MWKARWTDELLLPLSLEEMVGMLMSKTPVTLLHTKIFTPSEKGNTPLHKGRENMCLVRKATAWSHLLFLCPEPAALHRARQAPFVLSEGHKEPRSYSPCSPMPSTQARCIGAHSIRGILQNSLSQEWEFSQQVFKHLLKAVKILYCSLNDD